MDQINEATYFDVIDVEKQCIMSKLLKERVPGFTPGVGYGYYEFVEDQTFDPEKNVVLLDKVYV